ncbi:MAG TPA: NUDIX hydrolase [Ignavibacteria bacterium]|nr:NUDIX hydrolase [Ignavibacteria bacterium]
MKLSNNETVKLVADIALLFQNKVLLVKYTDTNKYDHQKGWFLPDDLINFNEHPEDAAKRIAIDQLGITLEGQRLDYMESFTGGDKSWHLIFHYVSLLEIIPAVSLNENVAKAEWFDLDKLPDDKEIAHHGWARYILEEIKKNK